MKKGLFCIGVAFVIVFIIHTSTFASGNNVIRIQGRVMEVDLSNRMMIVNEKTFVWDQNTVFYDEKGAPVTVDRLRTKTWVYIEGIRDLGKRMVKVEKIYLLPKYIGNKERHLYPFLSEITLISNE
jgi:hypothetical protein